MENLKEEIIKILVEQQETGMVGNVKRMVVCDFAFEEISSNIALFIQAITDPENQPNQYGVTLKTPITMEKDNKVKPTKEQIEKYCERLLEKFKQDPKYELRQELGKMLMRHIDTFTDKERKRYEELLQLLKD